MDYTLSMTFVNAAGDKVSISVTGAKAGITQTEASALMDTIISKDVFLSNGGSLTAKYAAQLTERAVTKFTVQ
ncbi:MAG: DUF2922 domain-containing protein [Clostridiaceae bacterium]|nr:DUF2922 domain-containing protein [Clostridiaceae bacterium]